MFGVKTFPRDVVGWACKYFIFSFLFLLSTQSVLAASTWTVTGGTNYDGDSKEFVSMAFHPITGEKYVAFQDAGNSFKATVKKYNATTTTWEVVGVAGFSDWQANYVKLAFHPATYEPYIAFEDFSNPSNEATVMRFNGSAWEVVGTKGFTASQVQQLDLVFDPSTNEPYVTYRDFSVGNKVSVMKFNGTSWVQVGSTGLSVGVAGYPTIAFNPTTDEPYIAFSDGGIGSGKASVMRFNGSSWAQVGTAGFSSDASYYINIVFNASTSEPYVAYANGSTNFQATVKKFNGSSWISVGRTDFNSAETLYLDLTFNPWTNVPYVAYQGGVKKLSGDSWIAVGSTDLSNYGGQTVLEFDPLTHQPAIAFAGTVATDTPGTVLDFYEPLDIVETPYALPYGDLYSSGQTIVLTSSTTGATIYYTIDGTAPTTSSTIYTGPISVTSSKTIKAVAVKSGQPDSNVMSEEYRISEWEYVGPVGLSAASSSGSYAKIVFNPITNEPYVSYQDFSSGKVKVFRYSTTSETWVAVGSSLGSGTAYTPRMTISPITGELYIYYTDSGLSYQGVVKKFDGTSWVDVGATLFDDTFYNRGIDIAIHPVTGEPYAVYDNPATRRAIVVRYDATSTLWTTVGASDITFPYPYSRIAFNPFTYEPYIGYVDASNGEKATVIRYSTTSAAWVTVGSAGFTADNVSLLSKMSFAFNPFTYEPYVAYADYGNNEKTTVMKYSTTSAAWVTVGSAGFSQATTSSDNVSIAFNPSTHEPYVVYSDSYYDRKLTVMRYDTASSTWTVVGLVPGFTPHNADGTLAFNPSTYEPYVAYNDSADGYSISVKKVTNPQAGTPTPSTPGGVYGSTQSVTLTSSTDGATIYYTTDGSTPTTGSTQYSSAISISSSLTLKALATHSGYTNSGVMSETYTITAPTAPTVTTGATSSLAETSVTLGGNVTDTGTEVVTERGFVYGTTVSYGATTSTTSPSFGAGAYTEGVTGLACEVTYHYAAYALNSIGTTYGSDATFTTSECVIPQTDAPTASPTGGTYTEGKTVTLSTSTPGALIFYTSDGSTPATTTSNQYTTPLSASSTVTYKAIAWASGYTESTVMTETYTITPSTTPTVTTGSAASITQSTVTLGGDITSLGTTNVTERGIIYGTTISYGATSSASSAGFSTGVFTTDITGLVCNTTYHFVAYAVNSIGVDFGSDATFTTAACTPIADAPTASPDGGTFTGTQTVTLSTSTPGALIFYTSDGSTPATTTSNQYTTPLSASSTVTYKAIAWASGYDASPVMTETYTITDYEVAEDKAALVVGDILGSNADADNIIVSLAALPSSGSINGSTITWSSDNTGTISHDGQSVNRPTFVSGDEVVNLTATITKGASSDTKTFVLTVKKEPAGNVSTITSNSYTVSALGSPSETITNVPYGTAKAVFLSALFKSQSYEVFTTTGINDPVTTGDTLVVTAQDGTTVTTYTITVASLTASQVVPDGSGIAVVNATTPEVVITDLGTTASVTIESGTSDATINLGSFIANGTGTIPAIQLTAENAHNMSIEIPASTVITSGSSTWNGILTAPTVTTITLPTESGVTKTLSTAIEVGFTGESLTFSKAVRLLIPNEAGKLAGYSISSTFTEITDTCASDSQVTGDALASGAECKIDVGPDLVIWTKHFTTFATYSETVTSSSGSSGGGGGGGSSSSRRTTTSTTTTTSTATSTTETSTAEIDRLLTLLATLKAQLSLLLKGTPETASSASLTRNLELGMEGEDVRALQVYLNTHGFPVSQTGIGSLGNETTYFGPSTKAAVIRFQNSHASTLLTPINLTTGTGYVGEKTRALMNGGSSAIASTPTPKVSVTPKVVPVATTTKVVATKTPTTTPSVSTATTTPKTIASPVTPTPTVPKVVTPAPVPVVVPKVVPVTPVAVPPPIQTLKLGMVSDDVLKLQLFLNNNGFLIAYSGSGSRGQESTSFGLATEAAVMRYQNEFLDELGMSEATGVVDRVTRAHMGF